MSTYIHIYIWHCSVSWRNSALRSESNSKFRYIRKTRTRLIRIREKRSVAGCDGTLAARTYPKKEGTQEIAKICWTCANPVCKNPSLPWCNASVYDFIPTRQVHVIFVTLEMRIDGKLNSTSKASTEMNPSRELPGEHKKGWILMIYSNGLMGADMQGSDIQ